jgi:hypothetical protein
MSRLSKLHVLYISIAIAWVATYVQTTYDSEPLSVTLAWLLIFPTTLVVSLVVLFFFNMVFLSPAEEDKNDHS